MTIASEPDATGSGIGDTVSDLPRTGWRKSTRSVVNGECVEVTNTHGVIAVRDSRNSKAVTLFYSVAEWRSFIADMKKCIDGKCLNFA